MRELFSYISKTKIGGVIPLDVVAHLTVSYAIFIYLLVKKNKQPKLAYFIVVMLSVLKEVNDSFTMTNTIEENIKDIFVSLFLPTLVMAVRYLKRKSI